MPDELMNIQTTTKMKTAITSILVALAFVGLVLIASCEKEPPQQPEAFTPTAKAAPQSIPAHAWTTFPATNIPKGGAPISTDPSGIARKWIAGFVRANSFGQIGPDATKSILKVPSIDVAPNQAGTMSTTLHNPIRIYPPQGVDSIPMSSFSCVITPGPGLTPIAAYFDTYTNPKLSQGYYYCNVNNGKVYLTWFSATPYWIKNQPMPLIWVIYNITQSGWIAFDTAECLISADGVNNYNVNWKPQFINKY